MAGTITVTHNRPGLAGRFGTIIFSAVADAADGSVPTAVLPNFNGKIVGLSTNPGATAPTDNYDIELIDAQSIDRLCGVGLNRDTANTEYAAVVFTSSNVSPVVHENETLTLTITNNSVNSAIIVGELFYEH